MEVTSLKELKIAVKDKEETIVVKDKKLIWLLKPLIKAKVPIKSDIGTASALPAAAVAVTTGVQITFILTLGVVVVLAILTGYDIKLRCGDTELVLEKK